MNRQFVRCASLTDHDPDAIVIYHEQLGCFYSDWHEHPAGQLVFAENGCIHLNSEGRKMLLPSWYGAWIPADIPHEIWSDSPQLRMRAICFPPAFSVPPPTHQLSVFPVSTLLREMLRHTEQWRYAAVADPQTITFLRAMQDLLPMEIAKATPLCLPSTKHEKLALVLAYIQTHLTEKISLALVADAFNLSTRTLIRLFTRELGMSFSGYGKTVRIMKALELIEAGCDNVSQLAWQVGYESVSTFSTNFLEICGVRPLQLIHEKNRANGCPV